MNAVFRSMRPPFLILAPICVFLGYAASVNYLKAFPYIHFSLSLIAAVLAHISVNTFNEYFDYQSGLDALTEKTPFSGGSGALLEQPGALNKVWWAAVLSLAGTIAVGLYFTVLLGPKVLPLGILGVFIILSYTQWLNKQPWLCLIAPGLAFGPLMVVGTALALTGEFVREACVVSLVPFFLVNNLLLLNQLPDIEPDKQVGRRHFPIVFGKQISMHIYALFALSAGLVIVLGVFQAALNALTIIGLVPIALSLVVYFAIPKHQYQIDKIIPFMGINVMVSLIVPLVLAVSLLFA